MKLNNKGFAITAVLYGLLILFVVLVSSYLLVLSAKKKRVETLVNDIEDTFVEITREYKLIDYITGLYGNSSKIFTSNNSIVYNYAPSVSLMNDGQGSGGGNIRYYGSNPKNYIYFNCKIYPNHDCEKWRIIGIVDGKVKIVRDSSLGNLSWDYDKNDNINLNTTDNNWNTSTLQKLLNNNYYNNQDTIYHNNSTDVSSMKFATDNIGLKTGITRDMVSASPWYLGECNNQVIYPNKAYDCERNGIFWTGKIALLYPSDYGYAADLKYCDDFNQYNVDKCKLNNWLQKRPCKLLTPSSSLQVWAVTNNGNISGDNALDTLTNYPYGVVPTLYLNDVIINGGNGSFNNPYKIKIGE